MKHIVVIVAGGVGKRMNADIPKQFLKIEQKTILQYTIDVFKNTADELVLVLPENQINTWKSICAESNNEIFYPIISGGDERFFSVKNAVDYLFEQQELSEVIISIHDGVRPLVNDQTINNTFSLAQTKAAVIPVVDLKDSLREVHELGSTHVDRNKYKSVQTPQSFQAELLYQAYQQPFSNLFTDDASVVENFGINIVCTNGNEENIKITTPLDLTLANILLQK